jgi:hypothetical protein
MTAIWPAGPPKVCREMVNQARTASRNGMTSLSGAVTLAAVPLRTASGNHVRPTIVQ